MKIVGIPGESTAPGHQSWIDLNSWSFGQTPGDGSPVFSPISVTTPDSRAIPPLMGALASGTPLTVTLQATNLTQTGRAINFLTITLSQATIVSLSEESHGGRPTDAISFRFRTIDYAYTFVRGGAKTVYDFCWDLNLAMRCPQGT